MGLTADPSVVQSVLVSPGATSTAEVMPVLGTALGYELAGTVPLRTSWIRAAGGRRSDHFLSGGVHPQTQRSHL